MLPYMLPLALSPHKQVLRHFAAAEGEAERLDYFCSAEGRDDLYAYNQREGAARSSFGHPLGWAVLRCCARAGSPHTLRRACPQLPPYRPLPLLHLGPIPTSALPSPLQAAQCWRP